MIKNISNALELEQELMTSEASEDSVKQLETMAKSSFLPAIIKINIYSSLASYYSISRDYSNTIRCSVVAVSMSDEKNYPFYAAANYLNMCDVFLALNDYEIAEKSIQRALDYPLDDATENRIIREFAYMDLADIHMDNPEKAREYLQLSRDYANNESDDYEYNELDRSLIEARILIQEHRYEEAKAIVDKLHTIDADNFALTYSLDYPLMEIETQLEILTGDTDKALDMANTLISHYQSDDTDYLSLKLIRSIIPLLEEKAPMSAEEYRKKFIDLYDEVAGTSDKFTSEFIFDTYSKAYNTYRATMVRTILIIVIAFTTVLIVVLFALFYVNHMKAVHDPLTGIYNRGRFNDEYKHLQMHQKQFFMIMCDIDYFKRINDEYGHEEGDIVLKKVAQTLSKQLNRTDRLFRVGGEEFCIITRNPNAPQLAEQLRKNIENLTWDKDFQITMSFGIADSSCSEDVYKAADKQLYHSKEHGRNMVSY